MFWKKKKIVEEKPKLSIYDIKAKVKLITGGLNRYIGNLTETQTKWLKKATELKSRGSTIKDVLLTQAIKRIALCRSKISKAEQMKWFMETRLEDYEMIGYDKEFLQSMVEITRLMGSMGLEDVDLQKATNDMLEAESKINAHQGAIEKMLTEMDDIMSTVQSTEMSEVEKDIDDRITAAVQDAQIGAEKDSETVTEEAIKRVMKELNIKGE